MNDVIYWIWLSQKNGAGHSDAVRLLKHFPGGAREIYEASREQLAAVKECSDVFIRRLADHDLSAAERTLEFCFLNSIRVIPCSSPNYPRRLHDLYNKPIVLYARGFIEDLNERFCVSIVGTRNMSGYGKHITFTLARQLIAYGAIIISGAAYGVDSAANSTAAFLEEPTVAVLGSGVNVPYPSKNKELLDYIGTNGMVISEFEPNTPPAGKNFPIRNRIISGLADAVVVVECGAKSGALITARCAQDQGRAVYAVPGNIGAPNSVGPNSMIRDGAGIVTRAEDIIEDFSGRFKLEKIDRIINSDKYLRYEYSSTPVRSENMPLSENVQGKAAVSRTAPANNVRVEAKTAALTGRYTRVKMEADVKSEARTAPAPVRTAVTYTKNAKPAAQQAANPPAEHRTVSSEKERVMQSLSDTERRVLSAFPDGRSVTTDHLTRGGIPAEDVMSSLTVLELYALIEALPGGLYRKLI